tara:strand:+ start:4664 stop:5122 length:459 start_codon:yes stop_codon:yes gene_type:complete
MLTNATKIAIRAMLYLAMFSNETKKFGVKHIAETLQIPKPFLSKLLQKLKKSNIVSSTKGPRGGFYLNKLNAKKSVWDIIVCIDNPERFDHCFLGLAKCSDENPCPVHFTVAPFKRKIMQDFKDKTIVTLANEIKNSDKVIISLKDFDSIDS